MPEPERLRQLPPRGLRDSMETGQPADPRRTARTRDSGAHLPTAARPGRPIQKVGAAWWEDSLTTTVSRAYVPWYATPQRAIGVDTIVKLTAIGATQPPKPRKASYAVPLFYMATR